MEKNFHETKIIIQETKERISIQKLKRIRHSPMEQIIRKIKIKITNSIKTMINFFNYFVMIK